MAASLRIVLHRFMINQGCHENTFIGHIAHSIYICYSMWNVSVDKFRKSWQNLILARCSKNVISSPGDRERLWSTDIHYLENPALRTYFFPISSRVATQNNNKFSMLRLLNSLPNMVGDISTVYELSFFNLVHQICWPMQRIWRKKR